MKKILFYAAAIILSQNINMTNAHSQCSLGTSLNYLDFNNVSVIHNTTGVFWNNSSVYQGGYEVPNGSGLKTIYSGSFWIAGVDPSSQVHLAANKYNAGDYFPGPIDNITGLAYDCNNFDQIWTVVKGSIMSFIQTGTPDNSILNWPARNNPNLSFLPPNQDLAPFVDVDNDGDYNPANGDYPAIKGDQSHFMILNDVGGSHGSGGDSLGFEIHIMAYQFSTNNDPVNLTTFYDFNIFNKSSVLYSDVHFGIFSDMDLGNASDDYVGCDTTWRVGFTYNGDDYDDTINGTPGYGDFPPVQGITMIDIPSTLIDSAKMSSFVKLDYSAQQAMNFPTAPVEYLNYMKGIWRDSTYMVYGGNGHVSSGGTQNYPYMFSDLPNDANGWSECTESNTPGDRMNLLSFGPMNLNAGEEMKMTFALVYHKPTSVTHCDAILGFLDDVEYVHNFYDSIPKPYLSVDETVFNQVELYPNPSDEMIQISGLPISSEVFVYDLLGKQVHSSKVNVSNVMLSTADFPDGIYFAKVKKGNESQTFKFVVSH